MREKGTREAQSSVRCLARRVIYMREMRGERESEGGRVTREDCFFQIQIAVSRASLPLSPSLRSLFMSLSFSSASLSLASHSHARSMHARTREGE